MCASQKFLKKLLMLMSTLPVAGNAGAANMPTKKTAETTPVSLYRAVNGKPATNLEKVIHLLGGIEKVIGPNDVVVIKPNVQWWNQGAVEICWMDCQVCYKHRFERHK
jgi:hypothetical protein